ncbi:MAG: hypothetical protein ACRC3Z_11245 [Phocaeicola sp.]
MKLELISAVRMYESICTTTNATYKVNYSITEVGENKNIKVTAEVLEGGVKIGTLQFSDDKISAAQFPYSTKFTTYINEFSAIVEEVKSLLADKEEVADVEQNVEEEQ